MAGEELLCTMHHQVMLAYHLCRKTWELHRGLRDVSGPLSMAELGVGRAMTSTFLLELFPLLHMTFVDVGNTPHIYELIQQHPRRTRFLHGTTADMASQVPDNSLDLLFIDAQHTYENVSEDIRNWTPKLKDTGILSGHDFARKFPGVEQAVRATGLPYETGPGGTWWFTDRFRDMPEPDSWQKGGFERA